MFLVLWVDHYGGVWSNQLYPKGFIIALISIYNYNNRDISRFLKKIKHLRNVKLSSNLSVNKEVNAVTCTAILTEVSSDEARLRM